MAKYWGTLSIYRQFAGGKPTETSETFQQAEVCVKKPALETLKSFKHQRFR